MAVVDQRAVLVRAGSRRRSRRAIHPGPPATPTSPAGRGGRAIAVQVLADQAGVVARTVKPDGQVVVRMQGVEAGEAAGGRRVAENAVVVLVLAGEESGARGAAERVVDEAALERRPTVADQRVDAVHHPHRFDRLVIGLDHDDVGSFLGGGALPVRRRRASQSERAPAHRLRPTAVKTGMRRRLAIGPIRLRGPPMSSDPNTLRFRRAVGRFVWEGEHSMSSISAGAGRVAGTRWN